MEKIGIKNICGHKVGLIVRDLRLNRSIEPGKIIQVEKEKFEEALTYPGVQELFDRKYLAMTDTQEAVDLGVISEEDTVTENGKLTQTGIEDAAEILKVLETGTDFQLKKLLQNQSDYRKEEIANIAAKSNKITLSKIEIIKNETGIDLQKILRD